MSKVHAILLVPANGDPHKLLREGPCGAMAPAVAAYAWGDEPWAFTEATANDRIDYAYSCHKHIKGHTVWLIGRPLALVLAWDGEVVVEGMDRAWRTQFELPWVSRSAMMLSLIVDARNVARDLGTVVLLDEEGREVVP